MSLAALLFGRSRPRRLAGRPVHPPEILETDRVMVGLLANFVVDLHQLQLVAVRVHVVRIVDALDVDLVVENWNIDALDRDYVTC